MASSRAGPVRRAMTGVVRCGSLAVLFAVLVSALLPSAATGSNETSHFPPEDTTPLRGGYIPPGGRTCTRQAAECVDGMLLPAWLPVNDISSIDRALRAIVYLLAMVYLFLGVSIIADRFMAAIEVITSTEREMTVCRPNGEVVVVNVRVWNETVSNLTLMALGSSAPEILLSIIEVIGNDFKAGDLGPGTIVGSAAFNLFVIIGLCVAVIPCTESRRIKHLRVFFITATWSVFAYLWLYVIISVSSPNVVEVWEAVLTFLFFPATVLTAYVADRKIFFYNFLSRRYRATVAGTAVRVDGREALELGEKEAMGDGTAEGKDAGLKEFEKTRQEYIDMLRELRKKHPDVDMHTLESMAANEMLNRGPKSRAFYRIQATRKLTGGGNIIKRKAAERRESLDDVAFGTTADDDVVRLFFEPGHYTVMENVGSVLLTVVRQGGDLTSTTTYVDFRTEDGTANAGSDYVFTEGTLIFQPGETQRHIEVQVIDDDVFEEDEHFFVNLSNARNGAENETSAGKRFT